MLPAKVLPTKSSPSWWSSSWPWLPWWLLVPSRRVTRTVLRPLAAISRADPAEAMAPQLLNTDRPNSRRWCISTSMSMCLHQSRSTRHPGESSLRDYKMEEGEGFKNSRKSFEERSLYRIFKRLVKGNTISE